MEEGTVRLRLAGKARLTRGGEFDILAITAGEGNGWQFDEDTLRESLPLWDGAECFIDHDWGRAGRSLRDLAGVLFGARWDESQGGVRARLRAFGPSGALLAEVGRQMLADVESGSRRPRVGFSADITFNAQGKRVEKILRVESVDLVFNPARGGAFLRALNSLEASGVKMAVENDPTKARDENTGGETSPTAVQLQRELKQARAAADGTPERLKAQAELEQARKVRAQMGAYLLDSALAAAKLPGPVSEQVRKQFEGRLFEPQELEQAVDSARKMVSDLLGGGVVQGPGRVHGMYSGSDQISAAIHDMLGTPRPDELRGLKAARLSGIRELYTLMTGDYDFVGGYHPDRAQFATSADLPGVLKNAMNKVIVQEWQDLGRSGYRWWEPVVAVEHFNHLQSITGVLVGEVTVLPSVAEGAAYTELAVSDSPEVGTWGKYGGYIGLTLEMFERDETHRLRQYPRKLASAALRRISALVGSIFTANAGTGPTMTDTRKVFDAVNHGNLGTGALTVDSWEAASQAIYEQKMLVAAGGTAPRLALDGRYLIVPRALRLTAMRILYPSWERESNIVSENMQRGEMGDVITCPEFTDGNDWAAAADPRLAPGIILGERFGLMPEIFVADNELNGALFSNDEIRMKVRHWVSVFVADYRPLYKSNVV